MHTIAQLEAGKLQGIKRLTLSESLTEFPMEILTLANSLEVLDLSNNQLSTLPEEISQLTQLKILFASNNKFKILPKALGLCQKLEMVGFKSNQITDVPKESLPHQLRWLILTDNTITYLPDTLGERPRLQKLALAGNTLRELPQSISQLHNLALLRISANQLTEFPKQLLNLPKLAWLAFAGNPFCESAASAIKLGFELVPEVSSKDYCLGEVLGQGASGVIYNATWVNAKDDFTEDIAVKVFKGEVTSDGYPKDELQACLKVGAHENLVKPVAQVKENDYLALIMALIPPKFKNLGLPPSLQTCTRDTFPAEFSLSISSIKKMVNQIKNIFEHMHNNKVCHGDLYAHNTLFDEDFTIIFGDFGAASMYHMLPVIIQEKIRVIEQRALGHFIDDLLSVCDQQDMSTSDYDALRAELIYF